MNWIRFHQTDNKIDVNHHSWYFKGVFLTIFAFLLLALGVWGGVDQGWWSKSIWASAGAGVTYRFTVSVMLVLGMACLLFGIPLLVLFLPPLMMFVGILGFGPVAAVVWYWICATLIGAGLLSWCKDESLTIWSVRNSGAGFVVTGTVIGLMAHFPINTPILYLALISAGALLSAWCLGLFKAKHAIIQMDFLLHRRRFSVQEACALVMALVGVALVMFVTMLPELGHDALSAHLNILARMLESRRWGFDVTQNIGAVVPMGPNWFMVPPYFLAGEHAAKLMDSTFVLATAWLSYQILRPRVGVSLALAAPALLLTLPLTMLVSGTVFVEPVIALLSILCLAELTGTTDKNTGGWLYLAAVAGYLCGSKLLGVPLVPILLVAAFVLSRTGRFQRPSVRLVSLAAVVFLLFSIQPYLVAYLKTGNPVFPFYNTVFKSPYFTSESFFGNGRAFANPLYLQPLKLGMLWESSLKSRVYGEFGFDGAIGIVFLVLIPLSVAASLLVRRWWVLGGVMAALFYCILVFQSQAYLRYLYQILPWFIVFGVWSLSHLCKPGLTGTILVVLMCLISLLRFPVGYGPLAQFSTDLIFDRSAHRTMLEQNKPSVIAGDIIRQLGSLRNKQVLLLGTDPVYSHFPAGTITDSWHSWPFSSSSSRDANLNRLVREFNIELIVNPVGWNEPREAEILAMTDEVFTLNGMRVGLVKKKELYLVERVMGAPQVAHNPSWQLGRNLAKNGGVQVTVSDPITQVIEVKGSSGLLQMEVSCPQGHYYRSQINWVDPRQETNGVDIKVHECRGDNTQIERIVSIPSGVTRGVLYGSSYDESPVLMKKISFKTTY